MIDCDLIASFDFMTDFNGINRHYPYPSYPSGVYDSDKNIYKYGPNSFDYPILALGENIYDNQGNYISAGFYSVVLSDDKKFLNLYQNNELKARVKVIKLVEEMRTQDELNQEAELIGKIKTYEFKKKLKKLKQAQEEYQAFLDTQSAKNFAKIEYSTDGYFVLSYSYWGKNATGIIKK